MLNNYKSVLMFITYVMRVLHLENNKNIDTTLLSILKTHKRTPEKGGELFYLPTTVYKRGWGDCDDFVTLASFILNKEKKPFKIGFLIKNNSAYHTFIESQGFVYDPWLKREPVETRLIKGLYKAPKIYLYEIKPFVVTVL